MSLTVKAYLKSSDEIRRFSIDEGVTTSYEYLSKKIAQVFSNLRDTDSFNLAYKDTEGDLVTFSSDDELIEGLGQLQEDIFRIYVEESKKKPCGPASGEDEPLHTGVICDGCEGKIHGPRFKCLACPDYDLCRKCKHAGIHTQHEFQKIRRPHGGHPTGHPFFGAGPWNPGMNRMPPFGGPWGCGPGMRRFWKQMHHQQQQQQGGEDAKPNENAGQSQEAKDAEDYLKQMGESVAQMLDPFGIDVDIDIEHGGIRHKHQGRRGGPNVGHGQRGKSPGKHGGKGKKGNKEEETTDPSTSEEKPMETASKSDDDTVKEKTKGIETDGGKTSGSDTEWTMVQDEAPGDPSEQDQRKSQALAQMKAMGFEDEGGWLSQLLKAKNFDIGRVLDAIKIGKPRVGGGHY